MTTQSFLQYSFTQWLTGFLHQWTDVSVCLPRICPLCAQEADWGRPDGGAQPMFLPEGERGAEAAAVQRPQE